MTLGLLVPPAVIFMLVCVFDPWYYGLICAGSFFIVEILIYAMMWYKLFYDTGDDLYADIERHSLGTPQ